MSIRVQKQGLKPRCVDVKRTGPRDVLRNPAGLNDTLVDLINTVANSDTAPTAQAEAVSRGLIAKCADLLGQIDAVVVGPIAAINQQAATASRAYVAG